MTDKLLRQHKQKISSLTLAPFADGRYEVFVSGEKLWSKLASKEFPDEEELLARIAKLS